MKNEITELLNSKDLSALIKRISHEIVESTNQLDNLAIIGIKSRGDYIAQRIVKQIEDISVSPNPFIIGKDEGLTITNFPANSTIQILNLSGRVVKKFQFEEQTAILNWNGKGDNGQYLNTGIYLVAAFSKDKGTGVTKLAIIRN